MARPIRKAPLVDDDATENKPKSLIYDLINPTATQEEETVLKLDSVSDELLYLMPSYILEPDDVMFYKIMHPSEKKVAISILARRAAKWVQQEDFQLAKNYVIKNMSGERYVSSIMRKAVVTQSERAKKYQMLSTYENDGTVTKEAILKYFEENFLSNPNKESADAIIKLKGWDKERDLNDEESIYEKTQHFVLFHTCVGCARFGPYCGGCLIEKEARGVLTSDEQKWIIDNDPSETPYQSQGKIEEKFGEKDDVPRGTFIGEDGVEYETDYDEDDE